MMRLKKGRKEERKGRKEGRERRKKGERDLTVPRGKEGRKEGRKESGKDGMSSPGSTCVAVSVCLCAQTDASDRS